MKLNLSRLTTWLTWIRRKPRPKTAVSAVALVRPVRFSAPPAAITGPKITWQRSALEYRTEKILTIADPRRGVDFGDVAFLDDGSVSLGSHSFSNGVEIVNHHMGACVANRGRGAKAVLVIDRHDGESYYYAFQHGEWYRLMPLTGSRNVFLQTIREDIRQHGPFFVFSWLRAVFNALYELAFTIGVSGVVLIIIREVRK